MSDLQVFFLPDKLLVCGIFSFHCDDDKVFEFDNVSFRSLWGGLWFLRFVYYSMAYLCGSLSEGVNIHVGL